MQYELPALCNSIFEVDENIRFVGMIDEMGKLDCRRHEKGYTIFRKRRWVN